MLRRRLTQGLRLGHSIRRGIGGPLAAACVYGIVAFGVLAAPRDAAAQARTQTQTQAPETLTLRPTPGTTVAGTVRGDGEKSYTLPGTQGQPLTLDVKSARGAWLVIRIFPSNQPTGSDVYNNFIDSSLSWTGPLPGDGPFTLQFSLRRAEARRGGRVSYTAKLALAPGASGEATPQKPGAKAPRPSPAANARPAS